MAAGDAAHTFRPIADQPSNLHHGNRNPDADHPHARHAGARARNMPESLLDCRLPPGSLPPTSARNNSGPKFGPPVVFLLQDRGEFCAAIIKHHAIPPD
jgi:hypothetical protein